MMHGMKLESTKAGLPHPGFICWLAVDLQRHFSRMTIQIVRREMGVQSAWPMPNHPGAPPEIEAPKGADASG